MCYIMSDLGIERGLRYYDPYTQVFSTPKQHSIFRLIPPNYPPKESFGTSQCENYIIIIFLVILVVFVFYN